MAVDEPPKLGGGRVQPLGLGLLVGPALNDELAGEGLLDPHDGGHSGLPGGSDLRVVRIRGAWLSVRVPRPRALI